MKTGTVELIPASMLTDAELSCALASPDELAQEAGHRLSMMADTMIKRLEAQEETLAEISASVADITRALADAMSLLSSDESELFQSLDYVRRDLEALSALVRAKEEAL